MRNTSTADLPPHIQSQVARKLAEEDARRSVAEPKKPKRSKYGNIRMPYKSIQGFERLYDSKGEARHARILDAGITVGLILWWIPQPVFPLPGERRSYRGDFLVVWADGRIAIQDFKGADTPKSKDRRKEVKAHYGIDVELVRK